MPLRSKTGSIPFDSAAMEMGYQPPRELIQRFADAFETEKAGHLEAAARLYQSLVREDPNFARAWSRLSQVELARRNPQAGDSAIRRALELEPENPLFHSVFGWVQLVLGHMDEAEAALRRAIELRPDLADAYYQLSTFVNITQDDPLLEAITSLLSRESAGPKERYVLHFAAGRIFNDLMRYDQAFHNFKAANDLKGSIALDGETFSPEERIKFCEDQVRVLDQDLFERRFGAGNPSQVPVFVVGMPRSGTSLVEQILASHPKVFGAGEQPDIEAIAGELSKYTPNMTPYPDCVASVSDHIINGFADAFLRRMRSLTPAAQRVVEKTPMNFNHLGLIALMFPAARIIHCRRDPVDTCLSCYFQNFSRPALNFTYNLSQIGFYYRSYRNLMKHWGAVLPIEILEVRYEEIVSNQERITREILDFCNLDWDSACLAFHQYRRPVQTSSFWEVRQPLYDRSVERWRRYEEHIGPLLEALGPYAEQA